MWVLLLISFKLFLMFVVNHHCHQTEDIKSTFAMQSSKMSLKLVNTIFIFCFIVYIICKANIYNILHWNWSIVSKIQAAEGKYNRNKKLPTCLTESPAEFWLIMLDNIIRGGLLPAWAKLLKQVNVSWRARPGGPRGSATWWCPGGQSLLVWVNWSLNRAKIVIQSVSERTVVKKNQTNKQTFFDIFILNL